MIKIYDVGENRAIYEDTESGLLQEVVNNSVIAEALPNRKANHARLEALKGELLNEKEGSL